KAGRHRSGQGFEPHLEGVAVGHQRLLEHEPRVPEANPSRRLVYLLSIGGPVRASDTRDHVGPGRPGLPGRILLAGALFAAAWGAATAAAQGPAPAQAPPSLSDREKERFLLEGKIVKRKSGPGGVAPSEPP